jgi:hypothetical protein
MAKGKIFDAKRDGVAHREDFVFECPGCGYGHAFTVKSDEPGWPVWSWNGDIDKPTFSPSLLVNASRPESRCHSFVKDGRIQFRWDCHHELKGKTVDLPEWED